MSSSNNWPSIQSGDIFQSLVNTLLKFECPGVRVFGRPGKDAGQDAISQSGATVYQYKYHGTAAFGKVLADARNEFTKIEQYKAPTHKHYELWKNVQEWTLISNVAVNPSNDKEWNDEIVTRFANMGLKAFGTQTKSI